LTKTNCTDSRMRTVCCARCWRGVRIPAFTAHFSPATCPGASWASPAATARTTCICATIKGAGLGGMARIGGAMKLLYAAILLALTSLALADDAKILANCPLQGDAKQAEARALNPLKRRMAVPQPADIDKSVTLEAMLAPGDDRGRWSEQPAAELT